MDDDFAISFDPIYAKHYILVDTKNRVIFGWSDYFNMNPNAEGATKICINDKGSVDFKLSVDGEPNPALYNDSGIPLYKWSFNSKKVLSRTEKEIAADNSPVSFPDATLANVKNATMENAVTIGADDISPGTEPDPPT